MFFYMGKHNNKFIELTNTTQTDNAKAEGKPLLYLFPPPFLKKWQILG